MTIAFCSNIFIEGKSYKEYSSDSPAAGTRFLQRPIFALAGLCSWDLFGGGLSGLGLYTWWAPYSFKFFEPRLLISPSDHSLSPFSRSPSGAWSPPGCRSSQTDAQVWRFEDLLHYCSYSLVDFIFLHFCLVDFDRLPL